MLHGPDAHHTRTGAGRMAIRPAARERRVLLMATTAPRSRLVAPLVNQAVEAIAPVIVQHGHVLDIEIDPGLPAMDLDGDRVEQALSNVIGNAVATLVIAKWEGMRNDEKLAIALDGGNDVGAAHGRDAETRQSSAS